MKIEHTAIDLNLLFKDLDEYDDWSSCKFEEFHVGRNGNPDEVYVRINEDPIVEIILTREEIGKICEVLK